MQTRHRHLAIAAIALVTMALLPACAPRRPETILYEIRAEAGVDPDAPLSGDALYQRKREMQRAARDLEHFEATFTALYHRSHRTGHQQFSRFCHVYLGTHVDPMLASSWQSAHPELMALDATLRLHQAEILTRLRDTARADMVILEVEQRFAERQDMLVDYPAGKGGTVAEAIRYLRARNWKS